MKRELRGNVGSTKHRIGKRSTWKLLKPLTLLLMMLLLLAACNSEPTGTSSQPGGGQQQAQQSIKIGFLADKTGSLASYGVAHEKVANAAVKHINDNGGINGRQLELKIIDTESNPSVGAMQARRLIEDEGVDFLVGSNSSGVVLAVAPIAKELKTVYFGTAGGALLSEDGKGNRYVFDFNSNVRQETAGAAKYIAGHMDKKNWISVVVDYAWGWDQETTFKEAAEANGLTVLQQIRVPLGTDNWMRYLSGKIPAEAEGVYFANFGTDFLTFIRDIHALRPDLVKVGGNYVIGGQDVSKLGEPAEGLYVLTGYPSWATGTVFDKTYRDYVGMDDLSRDKTTGEYLVPSYQWSTWETLHAIKDAVIQSGWKGKADTPKFIETLESMKFEQSEDYPEGDKYIRAEDHLMIKGVTLEQIKDGKIEIVDVFDPESMKYEPEINLLEDPLS